MCALTVFVAEHGLKFSPPMVTSPYGLNNLGTINNRKATKTIVPKMCNHYFQTSVDSSKNTLYSFITQVLFLKNAGLGDLFPLV